jgi:hypothetical protein
MVSTTASDVSRKAVIERLRVDLIGPRKPDELLPARPSDIYLTGILWPRNTILSPDEDERLAVAGGGETTGEDTDDQARPAAAMMRRPSTAGVSFAVRSSGTEAPAVDIEISFGVYLPEKLDDGRTSWRRQQVRHELNGVAISMGASKHPLPVEEVSGLQIDIQGAPFPDGTIATVTLVNAAATDERGREAIERLTIFQVSMEITPVSASELIARPSRRATVDKDDESAALLYRDAKEFAAGHTCSTDWTTTDNHVSSVRIAWLPDAITPAVSSEGHPVFAGLANGVEDPLSAVWLASAKPEALGKAVEKLALAYDEWIQLQTNEAKTLSKEHAGAAARHLEAARNVLARMKGGGERLQSDPIAAASFRLANLAMETQRQWSGNGSLRWRPFQLGFLLLALESTIDSSHPDREVMDLLWFPTGGGKTEAYLALIAFAAFYRRLSRRQPDEGAGVAAIMRYTLRLLTTQQFVRAAAMITACEAIRRGRIPSSDAKNLGKTPFSIGLWVGGDATPNRRKDAYDSKSDRSLSSPQQLSECPCCHGSLEYRQATSSDPVTIWCRTATCPLHGAHLPVWTVDDDVYQERPTLVIGTVDKFAQIVRKKETALLFGVSSSAQPQLILQDELHLIAGPLGTLAGLYETALDLILSANGSRPKIIGSTATIRRADEQVLALFDRRTCQFPPPGLNSEDSGFAIIDKSHPGRCYVGVTTAGRSAKFALQAVMASLLQTAATGLSSSERDPYWTLVAYFNSLRELGGALVLAQDDVNDTLQQLSRARKEQTRQPDAIEELTSRRTQLEIRDMLNRLSTKAGQAGALDVVLATNMLSVGVDIPRLGLMLVNGQPKTMAEYIQATSRVGRGAVSGLVVPVLNSAKPRDRSHFETFKTWHSTLYRDVEATSVTPFASRARDRALHAVLVAAIRHLIPNMLDRPDHLPADRTSIEALIEKISQRASRIDRLEIDVKSELFARLDSWTRRSPQHYWWNANVSLMQGAEEAAAKRASGRIVGQAWPTPNSLRAVEPATPFRLVERLR